MAPDNKVRVLIVDDDASLLKLVSVLLERAGMEPIIAENAQQAADILRAPPLPNVVLLDLMLPEVSGIEFLRQMREKEQFDDLPIVVLSALADADTIREALDEGADRYLTKPYLAKNLISTLRDLLNKGRKR